MTGDAQLGEPVAERARRYLRQPDREQRDQEEHGAAVDQHQQDQHQQEGGPDQRAVDVLEHLDGVRRVAGAAGHLGLEPAARIGDQLASGLDRLDDRLGLPVAGDAGDRDGGGSIPRGLGRSELRRGAKGAGGARIGVPEPLLAQSVEAPAVGGDPASVGRSQPAFAPVDHHHRRELAARQRLRLLQRPGGLRIARQERRRLVLLGVGELRRQVEGERRPDGDQPRERDEPLDARKAGEGEDRGHGGCRTLRSHAARRPR